MNPQIFKVDNTKSAFYTKKGELTTGKSNNEKAL